METTKTPLTQEEKVQRLFNALEAKKAEVMNAEKPQYITGGQFRYSESVGNTTDISVVRDIRKLVEILAFLKERAVSYAEAAAQLKVDASFTWLGFNLEEWTKDLQTRVSVLQIAKVRAELIELEARINKVVTPAMREQMETAALEAALGID